MDFSAIKWNDQGLVPAIAQDVTTGKVLMMAHMNRESLEKTIETGFATYWSRSRQTLWQKGETSGNVQRVHSITADCDGDTLLVLVDQQGPACHTGDATCFEGAPLLPAEKPSFAGSYVLQQVMNVILDRQQNPKEGSYTNYLFTNGVDKICKKVGEESAEVIIAAKNNSNDELRYEAADLVYHLLVLFANQGLKLSDLFSELASRR